MTISKKDDLSKQYHNTLKNTDDPPLEFGINNSDFKILKLYAEYAYLDTDERRRFSQMSHEYLIEQLQFEEFVNDTTLNLNFNHPVKELIWCGVPFINPHETSYQTLNVNRFQRNYEFISQHQEAGAKLPQASISEIIKNNKGDRMFSSLTTQTKLHGGISGPELSDFGRRSGHYMIPNSSPTVFGLLLDENPKYRGDANQKFGYFNPGVVAALQKYFDLPSPVRPNNNFTSPAKDFNITLKLNGNERFSPQGITYFTRKQIYEHHTGSGSVYDQDVICVYSFA